MVIEGHAWFVSTFVCMIAIPACIEEVTSHRSIGRLLAYGLIILAAAAIGIYGLVRYQKILSEAERLGEQATCSVCGAYARFRLISPSDVRCRKCQNEWRLIDG